MTTFYIPIYCGTETGCANEKCLIQNEQKAKKRLSRKYTCWFGQWNDCLNDKITLIENYWIESGDKDKYQIKVKLPDSKVLTSASLALLLLPITEKETLLYTHTCITGDFEKKTDGYNTKSVDYIKNKFEICAKDFEELYTKHDTFAFIYVSNKDEIDEDLLRQYPWITVKRFSEGTPVIDVINYLKTGLCESCESDSKVNRFMDSAYQKICNYLDSDSYNEASVTAYLSGADNSKYVYDRRLYLNYQRFIKQNKKLSLNINCTKSLDLYDLVSDTIVQDGKAAKKLKPVWQQQLEKNHSAHIDETVERLNQINDDIESDIRSIKKFIYNQSDSQHLLSNCKIQYNQCNSPDVIETARGKIITPSFYSIVLKGENSQRKEIAVYTDSCKLFYEENSREKLKIKNQKTEALLKIFAKKTIEADKRKASKEIMNIIADEKKNRKAPQIIIADIASYMKENNISFPTKFVLTGLPGIGKTTSLYYIARLFDLEVISTEILINYYIFNDDLAETERFDYEKYWKDVDLHKLYNDSIPYYTQYSRKIFEKLADNSEHMKHIRDLACKIGLELVEGSDRKALLDLGGKEALTNLYYVFKQQEYKNIFITAEGNNEEEVFENYLSFYKKDKNLCNESRRNIKKLALKKVIKNDEEEATEIDTESEKFRDSLKRLIFTPRYKYYKGRSDCEIIRKQTDDIATTVLQILEVLFSDSL